MTPEKGETETHAELHRSALSHGDGRLDWSELVIPHGRPHSGDEYATVETVLRLAELVETVVRRRGRRRGDADGGQGLSEEVVSVR